MTQFAGQAYHSFIFMGKSDAEQDILVVELHTAVLLQSMSKIIGYKCLLFLSIVLEQSMAGKACQ